MAGYLVPSSVDSSVDRSAARMVAYWADWMAALWDLRWVDLMVGDWVANLVVMWERKSAFGWEEQWE
jgi:hypothetical protein